MIKNLLYAIMILFITGTSINAQFTLQNAFPNLSFNGAVFLTHADDSTDRIFIVEQAGRIKVFPNSQNASVAKEYLNITDRVSSGGEKGLLGLAFHPDYESNGYIYVNYTNATSTVISRFQVTNNPDSADKNTEFQLLTFTQPYSNHNGGWIGFGPNDGYLYIATGDGGSGGDPQNYAQRINTLLGKILRLDVDGGTPYAIPPTNPFIDSTNVQVRKEIYAWGLRNPWRCSFDLVTGWLFAGDVGQGDWEEIDVIENGKNYGWRCYEGNHTYNMSGCNYPEYIFPIWEYSHSVGYSITGGYVYRGVNVPELLGKYIYADYGTRRVWALSYDGITPPSNELLLTAANNPTSFGVDQADELYLVGFSTIYRFTPTVTSTDNESSLSDYTLEQNYPNPFNPSTVIRYNLPEDSDVTIKIYDAVGREIDSITTGFQQKGYYQKTWNAERLSSGVYLVKMNAKSLSSDKEFSKAIKMIYLK
ncbi:MAG: PQQ-dependent sugar dehydrogenase [Ignavibacteriaceae bacterium]|nr:PQQ-dependent sugar dehydrogenase [Ignavibacteriaceae bacterium]